LDIQSVRDSIKEGVTLLADSVKPLDRSILPKDVKVYLVDATGICIQREFMHSSGPILNIPMLGAFGKITGYYDLDIMEKVLKKEFGEKKIDKNMSVARDAYETVKEV
jgi:Pyruvate/2-oxoacid:ferredoxin oxidoreductase gamma subunit